MKLNTNNNNGGCLQFHLLISIDIYGTQGPGQLAISPARPDFTAVQNVDLFGELLFHSDITTVNDVELNTTSGDLRLIVNS